MSIASAFVMASMRQKISLCGNAARFRALRLLSTVPSTSAEEKPPVALVSDDEYATNAFGSMGLTKELVTALMENKITQPTLVQKTVIPRLLARENIVMAASTGSGKTLAYSLPTVQHLVGEELVGYKRIPQRPRCLVLVPTRELARQVLQSIKQLGHFAKVSSSAVLGGEDYAVQKASLNRLVDIVVASPGRLMQHKQQGNVFFSQVNTVIIDEVDTMLTQGFGPDIRSIMQSVLRKKESEKKEVQVVMATATLTNAVKKLLSDVEGGGFLSTAADGSKVPNVPSLSLKMVEVDGVHRTLPHVKHNFEETKGRDKLVVLRQLLDRNQGKMKRTLVFCNTIDSCRAAEYAINDGVTMKAISYHGDMNSRDRQENLEKFRNGEETVLVCTDIAARGLDIVEVDHVVLFDFPLNPVDYIHRAGRCGRAGRKGTVTSIIAKRDEVLATAIQAAIAKGLPIDGLSSSKRDYTPQGKLSHVFAKSSSSRSSSPDYRSSSGASSRFSKSPVQHGKIRTSAFTKTRASSSYASSESRGRGGPRSASSGKPMREGRRYQDKPFSPSSSSRRTSTRRR